MKHKRVFYTLTVVMYIVVVLLSLAFLFSIKQVKANYDSVTNSNRYLVVEDILNDYKGKNLLFVNTNKIADRIEKDNYLIVKSIKKDFPNKILVEIEEREEAFIVESDIYRYYLDKNYYVLKKVDKHSDILDNNLISLDLTNYNDFNTDNLKVGETYTGLSGWIKNSIGEMISIFSDWKNILNQIKIEGQDKIFGYTIYFKTRQGIEIEIQDPNIKLDTENNTFTYQESLDPMVGVEEVREAYKVYSKISDYEKTSGNLLVYRQLEDGKITVIHTKHV